MCLVFSALTQLLALERRQSQFLQLQVFVLLLRKAGLGIEMDNGKILDDENDIVMMRVITIPRLQFFTCI